MITLQTAHMHFNKEPQRQELLAKQPWLFNCEAKVLSFINLCIYPYKFELVYEAIRTRDRITAANYDAIKGVIAGLLVLNHRQHPESVFSIDNYVVDFIRFIRSDKESNPTKFLLSMRVYMPRFLFAVGLQIAFGIDWRDLVFDALDLKKKPQCRTYHTLFTNLYLRNLLSAYIIWKNYREPQDEDYVAGVNDVLTLLSERCKLKKSLEPEKLQLLFEYLQTNLPSWSLGTRRKAAWAIDTAQDGTDMIHRQFSEWRYKQVQG